VSGLHKPLHLECPESVSGHDTGGRTDGRCTWCRARIDPPAPRPEGFPVSALTNAYGYYYDPDYEP
jgi:hypothetical protein